MSLSVPHAMVSACNLPLQVAYWHVYDGSVIRELEGSKSGAINGMHISQDGRHFVTGNAARYAVSLFVEIFDVIQLF